MKNSSQLSSKKPIAYQPEQPDVKAKTESAAGVCFFWQRKYISMLPLIIFYSWQSKTDEKKNRYFIRDAAEKAVRIINEEDKPELHNFEIVVQDSTRGVPGTPDIPETIKKRIRECDIFLSDITMIMDPDIQPDLPEPHYSNNVMLELGFAQSVVDSDRIITVLNNDFGSVRDDLNKIPFDNRQLRAPIEYSYDKAKDQFVSILKKAIEDCLAPAIIKRKTKYQPFESWEEYGRSMFWEQDNYIPNAKFEEILGQIRNIRYDLRIIGTSGMGKSRAVFEAFRDRERAYSNQFLYLDIGEYEDITDIKQVFSRLPQGVIVVLDNIDTDDLRTVMRWKRKNGLTNPIISLFNDPDELAQDRVLDVVYITIMFGDMADVIEQMIAANPDIPEDVSRRIKEFSDGVPFMAEMMLNNYRKDPDKDYAKLTDSSIVDRLLPGINPEERHILRSISIFKQVGCEDEMETEIRFVLTSSTITPRLTGDEKSRINIFRELKEKCLQIGIFERRGRYIHIRPRPLALYLAGEWFKGCDKKRISDVIQEVQAFATEQGYLLLNDAICGQIKYLASDEKARQLFGGLMEKGSSFDNAELLNTELGSRLFRTIAEVNPEATASCLWRLLSPMTTEQLLAIDEGRRNLVWGLEKICFKPETFEKGTKLMMLLAVAENESISNNATGVLKDLFHVLLPGTLANLDQRAQILDWAMSQKDTRELGLACLRASLATDNFMFMSGAETFGTQKLEHYSPTMREMKAYWTHNLALLSDAYKAGNKDEVSSTIERAVVGFTKSRCFSLIRPIIVEIAEDKNWKWEDMRDSMDLIEFEYLELLTPDEQKIIKEYHFKLTPQDFVSRVGMVESRFRYRDAESWEKEMAIKCGKYQELAEECVSNDYLSKEIIYDLITRYDNDSLILYGFGFALGNRLKGNAEVANKVVDHSIDYFLESNYAENLRQSTFFFSFVQGYEEYTYAAYAIRKHQQLSYFLFTLFGLQGVKVEGTEELYELVGKGICAPSQFLHFCNRINWMEQEDESVIRFFDRLMDLGPEGQRVVLKLAHNRVYRNEPKTLDPVAMHVVEAVISKAIEPQLNDSDYLEYIEVALERMDVPKLALFINDEFIGYYAHHSFQDLPRQEVESIYRLILSKYFEAVWPVLSKQLISEDTGVIAFHYKYMLGTMIGGLSGGVMFSANHDEEYMQWCKDYPEKAPWILAMFTPVFAGEEYHPLVKFLIAEYAGDERVMNTLSANMRSFAWTGSIVPLYQKRRECFVKMLPEADPISKRWIEKQIERLDLEIKRQSGREAEEDLIMIG